MNSRLFLAVFLFLSTTAFAADPFIPEGDPSGGPTVFESQQCFRCHTLEGVELPDIDLPATLKIHLGGAEYLSWDRDAFAKAILNPKHVVAPQYQAIMIEMGDKLGAVNSPMPNFNQQLTVADLIDLATYLSNLTAKH